MSQHRSPRAQRTALPLKTCAWVEYLQGERGLSREWIRAWISAIPNLETYLQSSPLQRSSEFKRWPRELRDIWKDYLDPASWEREAPAFFSFLHPDFPHKLQECPDPPCGLYYRGRWELLRSKGPWIGVVGTRDASDGALKACRDIVRAMQPYRPVIVSGMARGIDACAHRAALDLGLVSLGVLGTPVDRVYPRENAELFRRMSQEGLLLSELSSRAELGAWRFPERNRLIAALAEALLVVEAPRTSGALWTAQFALELGREIFVVPGPWGERNRGGHRLIQQGAHLLTDPAEIFRILGYKKKAPAKKGLAQDRPPDVPTFTGEESRVLAILKSGPAHIDKIAYLSQIPAPILTVTLNGLSLRDILLEHPGKLFEIKGEN